MTGPHRSPVRGSVGSGGATAYPEAVHRAPPPPDEATDPDDPWDEDEGGPHPFIERLDLARRKYIPLPDEVVYEFLGEEEFVVHSDHPSFRAFLTQNLALVILIPIIGPLLVYFGLGALISWTTVGIFLLFDLIVAALLLRRLGDRYTSYVITNMRLIKITGILRRRLASIPWTGMTGLGFNQTAMGRILGYATIKVESANEESGLREFSDVSDPALFHQRLLDMASARNRAAVARQVQNQLATTGTSKRKRKRRGRKAPGGPGPGHRPVGRIGGTAASSGGAPPREPGELRDREGPPGRETFGDIDAWPDDEAEDPWPDEEPAPSSARDGADEPWPDEPSPDDSPDDITPPEGQPRIVTDDDAAEPPPRTKSGRPRPRPRPPADTRTPPGGQARVPDTTGDESGSARGAASAAQGDEHDRDSAGRWGWLRWPGANAPAEPDTPAEDDQDDQDEATRRPHRRERKPAQQAPQKPETIVVPRQAPAAPPPSGRPPRRGRRRT